MRYRKRITRGLALFCLVCLTGAFLGLGNPAARAQEGPAADAPTPELPLLHPKGAPYRTPLAGEGFRAKLFGREITVQPRDRRSVSAWNLGAAIYKPAPEGSGILPLGDLYFWRHPDDKDLLRATVSGVYNNFFRARSPRDLGPFEWVLTFTNFTVPFAQAELVDGRALKSEELLWGYVRPGIGLGYRRQVWPGHQDNMFAVDLTLEPGVLFFGKGPDTAANFIVPQDTMELRAHLQMRWDALERNLLELPHQGFAAGADLVYGYRPDWENWGVNGSEAAKKGRDYLSFTGYFLAAGGVPWVESDRHRLIGSVHGGIGRNLDRFSSPRVGGGMDPVGEEYGSIWRPVMPGAVIQEFSPRHYLLATGEYRWEPVFFAYLSLDASVGWLDRLRRTGTGIYLKNNILSSLGGQVTTGFFFQTRLQLIYNYNFSVVRKGRHGGQEVIAQISRSF